MSKASVRKAIADFDKEQLRELLLDLYSKSKEAKEILDFYADPDINGKLEEYYKLAAKELERYHRRLPAPRVMKLRSLVKKFKSYEVGDDAVAKLMYFIVTGYLVIDTVSFEEAQINSVCKFLEDFLVFMNSAKLNEIYIPKLDKLLIRPTQKYGDWLLKAMRNSYEVTMAELE